MMYFIFVIRELHTQCGIKIVDPHCEPIVSVTETDQCSHGERTQFSSCIRTLVKKFMWYTHVQ